MKFRAHLLIILGPFKLVTKNNYISWGRWGLWVHPFGPHYKARVTVTRFGPGSKTWYLFRKATP